jgi:hypothetical protein
MISDAVTSVAAEPTFQNSLARTDVKRTPAQSLFLTSLRYDSPAR